jgi:diadenosine tetraphosphate (Ap4A) HIT family hydrolase
MAKGCPADQGKDQIKGTVVLMPDQNHRPLDRAIRDGFPVTEQHTLIIPKRHMAEYFDLTQAKIDAVNQILAEQKVAVRQADSSVTGFNIGMDCGEMQARLSLTFMHT